MHRTMAFGIAWSACGEKKGLEGSCEGMGLIV